MIGKIKLSLSVVKASKNDVENKFNNIRTQFLKENS